MTALVRKSVTFANDATGGPPRKAISDATPSAASAPLRDITLRRHFHFTEKLGLQFRSDFFNILNHPNFGSPINYMTSPQFGQSTQMLNNYLGSGGQSGGLNPLYQIGGPRSIKLALSLHF